MSRSPRTHAARATVAALALAGLGIAGFGATAASADTAQPSAASTDGGIICDILTVLCPSPTATVTATTTVTATATATISAPTPSITLGPSASGLPGSSTPSGSASDSATPSGSASGSASAGSSPAGSTSGDSSPAGSTDGASKPAGSAGAGTPASSHTSASAQVFTNITVSGLRITRSKGRLVVGFTVDNTGTTAVGGVLVTAKASGYASKTWLVRLPVGLPVKVSATWPSHKRGTVRVSVKADASNQLVESNENDNAVAGTKVLR